MYLDDETRKALAAMDARIDEKMDLVLHRLDAILIRLEEADASHDRLMGMVDRLGVLARAEEEAMTSLDALAKRVAKLEAARRGDN
jgi:polyhydroxyalkanoate synthesis regulator phasin